MLQDLGGRDWIPPRYFNLKHTVTGPYSVETYLYSKLIDPLVVLATPLGFRVWF